MTIKEPTAQSDHSTAHHVEQQSGPRLHVGFQFGNMERKSGEGVVEDMGRHTETQVARFIVEPPEQNSEHNSGKCLGKIAVNNAKTNGCGQNREPGFQTYRRELSLNTIAKDDFFDKLASVINNDETITATKRNNLRRQYESGDLSKYLVNVFMYALNKPNKGYVTRLEFDDGRLFEEADQRCPLCNEPLVVKRSDRTLYFFSIVKIFPEIASETKKLTLSPFTQSQPIKTI